MHRYLLGVYVKVDSHTTFFSDSEFLALVHIIIDSHTSALLQ